MSKRIINVRTLYQLDIEQILELKRNFSLRFEDDVVYENCYFKDIIFFRAFTDFIVKYDVMITSDIWIGNHYNNGYFSNKTYSSIYSKIYRAIVKPYIEKHKSNEIAEDLFKDFYLNIESINRLISKKLLRYSLGLSVTDALHIQFDKDLIKSMIKAAERPSPQTIQDTYKTLDKVISKPIYHGNSIALMYLSGIGNAGQMKQWLASRGYITELNSKIFSVPMTNSFTLGFKNIYEAIIESRAGTKALWLSGKSIQDAEYANREITILTMLIKGVVHEDCGNPTYVDVYVKDVTFDELGNKVCDSDLHNMVGKRYICPDTNVEKVITKDDKHLIGRSIKIREAMYCGYKDKYKICRACIGEIADSILVHQNLGSIITVTLMVLMSQGLLSAKHLLKTAESASIKLLAKVKQYLIIRENENLYFRANVLNKKVKTVYLKVRQDETWGLDNIMKVKDIFSINVNKVSKIDTVSLIIRGKHGEEEEIELPLKVNGAKTFLSKDLLAYVIKNGYETYDEEHYLININDFNHKEPVFKYDKIEFNLALLNKEFKSMLKSHKFKSVDGVIRSEYTPSVLVQNLFDLLNSKLSVNRAIIEVIVYAFTVNDITNQDYDLGRAGELSDIIGFKQAIDYRSLGASYNWDDLQNKVFDPMLYKEDGKPDHPMDVFLKPNEVLKYDLD